MTLDSAETPFAKTPPPLFLVPVLFDFGRIWSLHLAHEFQNSIGFTDRHLSPTFGKSVHIKEEVRGTNLM